MITKKKNDWQFRPATSKKENQQTKIFKLLMSGRRLTRIESVA